mmetsp:Transcript_3555/g.4170  ORF Transcript_3555/g.4170 Transcript_3555/m.4170 type:complete len:84 (+) Transcript_3555:83-334(+)
MSLNPTRAFKIKNLDFRDLELSKHSILSTEEHLEHLMTAIRNCSLKDSLEDVTVDSEFEEMMGEFKYEKGGFFSWTYKEMYPD